MSFIDDAMKWATEPFPGATVPDDVSRKLDAMPVKSLAARWQELQCLGLKDQTGENWKELVYFDHLPHRQAERGFEQERDFRAEEACVIGERCDVAADRLEAAAVFLGHVGQARLLHEHDEPPDTHETFARLRVQFAVEPDALDHRAQIAAVRRVAADEDASGYLVEVAADALECVSDPFDE